MTLIGYYNSSKHKQHQLTERSENSINHPELPASVSQPLRQLKRPTAAFTLLKVTKSAWNIDASAAARPSAATAGLWGRVRATRDDTSIRWRGTDRHHLSVWPLYGCMHGCAYSTPGECSHWCDWTPFIFVFDLIDYFTDLFFSPA